MAELAAKILNQITMTTLEKQQFIIDQLKPYFIDPSTCGYEKGEGCLYETKDGKMCVAGKNMKPEYRKNCSGSIDAIIDKEGQEVFISASQNKLSLEEWTAMQLVHDSLAGDIKSTGRDDIETLEELSETDLSELKELLKEHNHA